MPAALKYLLHKNLIILNRNWRWTVTEQLIVVIIFIVVVINPVERSKNYRLNMEEASHTQFFKNQTNLYDLSTFEHLLTAKNHRMRFGILYTPNNNFTTEIVKSAQHAFNLHHITGVGSEQMIVNYFIESNILVGIVFHNVDRGEIPKKLSVTLRFPSEFRTIKNEIVVESLWITRCSGVLTPEDTNRYRHTDLYLREGFLQIQHRIFMEWLRVLKFGLPKEGENEKKKEEYVPNMADNKIENADSESNPANKDADENVVQTRKLKTNLYDPIYDSLLPRISVSSMRHLTDREPCYTEGTSNFIWFLYYFTFFLPFLRIIKRYAREREENIQVHHWTYGYEGGHHRIANFIVSYARLFILDLLIVMIVSINWTSDPKIHIFRDINSGILLIFLMLYSIMLITYAMIVATFFVDTTNSVLFGAVMWLGNYGLFSMVLDYTTTFSSSVVFSFIFFFNNFFPFGMRLMKNFGQNSDHKQIRNLFVTQIGTILILLFILSLAEYVRPGRYIKRFAFNYLGIPYFCRRKNEKVTRKRRKTIYTIDRPVPSWHHYEYGPIHGREILYVKNIVTYLDRNQINQQLKNITMRFFRSEISVILGAHSAGKTHLISILAGWRKPSAGYVYYDGDVDIFNNSTYYRRFVDCSMPNNPLFDLLTVRETLEYFCKVKIEEFEHLEVQIKVKKWLNIMKPLINDELILVKDLNFSQKRILSLCCTLLCDRPIILLDEPTLHMTVKEQRFYWQILQEEKENRAIIVATFSIDEADAIGDRIGILNDGYLVAYGSSFFLRSRFGYGFDMIILKDPKQSSAPITKILHKYIVNIMPDNEIGDQLIYKLPADKRFFYQRMLIELEKESKSLGIRHIKMSGSELSEIYMTLGMQTPYKQTLPQATQSFKFINESEKYLKQQQIRAMLYKKMIHQAPNIIPVIMILAVFLLILLINEMTKRIEVPSSVNTGIDLGLGINETSRSLLTNYTNCKYVEVNELEAVEYISKINNKPRYYIFKKLRCGKESYEEETRRDSGIYDKLGAVEIIEQGKDMTIWINERIFHTAALALNLAHNLILQDLYSSDSEMLTTIVNKPMIIPLHTKINIMDNQISHLRVPLTMGIVMPMTMSCFIVSLIEEKHNHLFTLQRLAGIRMNIFWLVGILWDFGTFFSFSLIYILTMTLTTIEGFGANAKLLTFLLINVHGLAALSMIYLMSLFMGDSKSRAFLIALLTQYTFGLCAYIFYWDVVENNQFYFFILNFSPTFALLDAISNLYTETKEQEYCAERCQAVDGCNAGNICGLVPSCCFDTFFKWSPPGILPSLLFMFLSIILFGILFFFISLHRKEKKHSLIPSIKEMGTVCFPGDDIDVVRKKMSIASMSMTSCKKYNILVDQIEDCIPENSKRLNTVSFALDKHISMGIYGSRHSGKSHLIHQLIGDHGYRFGEMYICEKDCKYEPNEAYKYVGFCPQDRGLCDAFTPRQLFTLLFMIRGLPEPRVNEKLREISMCLNLRKNMCKRIGILPTAIKRKINIAIALIVYNKVLVLDEPTRGMPALESRIIWNVLRYARYCGNTIIFSSNDSLECEALSDFMIVIDKGEMLAIGSPHYLKRKYTKGFYLEVKLLADGSTAEEAENNLFLDVENMIRYTNFLHEDSVLVNRSDYTLKFFIPVEKITYSYLFGSLEKSRNRLNISDYTIRQVSLLEALDNIHATRLLREPYKTRNKISVDVINERRLPPDDKPPEGTVINPRESLRQSLYNYGDDTEREDDVENNEGKQTSNSEAKYNRHGTRHRSVLYSYGDEDDDNIEDGIIQLRKSKQYKYRNRANEYEIEQDSVKEEKLTDLIPEEESQTNVEIDKYQHSSTSQQNESMSKIELQAEIHSPPENQAQIETQERFQNATGQSKDSQYSNKRSDEKSNSHNNNLP